MRRRAGRPPGPTVSPRAFPRRLWWSGRAIGLHLTLAVVLPLFTLAFIWQVDRVRQGNELSWAYVFEWPFFAGYAVYLWWKLIHDQAGLLDPGATAPAAPASTQAVAPGPTSDPAAALAPTPTAPSQPRPPVEDEEDEELAAYNRYLAELHASGRQKHW